MIYALLLPEWAKTETTLKNFQAELSSAEAISYNGLGYNIYFYPNYPSLCANPNDWLNGRDIDTFEWVYLDMDLKDGAWKSKDEFLTVLLQAYLIPTRIVDSGNGLHAYWRISDLTPKSFLQINRQLARAFKTDLAVGKIKQLMRVPGTYNTKDKENPKLCEILYEDTTSVYTAEQIASGMSPLSLEDASYCTAHYNKTYDIQDKALEISDKIPDKFRQLLLKNQEVNNIWSGNVNDRSESDFRLGHLMLAAKFTKEEAATVLTQSAKALGRAPAHRISYATNIVDKIWGFVNENKTEHLSESVTDILQASGDGIKGTRFSCWKYIDNTAHGFRLTQVIGLVAGSGVGKTAVALNMFHGFVHNNPEYDHFFVPLEQPKNEIAERWAAICGPNTHLHSKVQVLSNYDSEGKYRHLSLKEIEDYIVAYSTRTGRKVGCVVIDHIGVLKNEKNSAGSATQKTLNISEEMKAFALRTNTLLVMQSQTNREKAGDGDLELNKDAAFGSSAFENFCDYLITVWQPLKKCYSEEGCPTITAFKFCKIRHKTVGVDKIQEDVPYSILFDTATQTLQPLTQEQEKGLLFWVTKATNKRKADKRTDIVSYVSARYE